MRIVDVVTVEALGGWWHSDFAAIKSGLEPDGFVFKGEPITPGFKRIREPARGLGVLLVLEDGQVAHGDCITEAYPGRPGGRDPHLSPGLLAREIDEKFRQWLVGREVGSFRESVAEMEERAKSYQAVYYGLSQALLDAVARSRHETMAETVVREYGSRLYSPGEISINLQMGPDRDAGIDKAILRRADLIHTGSVYNPDLFARQLDYIAKVRDRILAIGDPDYKPMIHLDQYGHVGRVLGLDPDVVVDYLWRAGRVAGPFGLVMEDPVNHETREAQAELMAAIRQRLDAHPTNVVLLADEFCSTWDDHRVFVEAGAAHVQKLHAPDVGGVQHAIEIILMLKGKTKSYYGGSASETDRAAQVRAQISVATGPDFLSPSPGMGVDECHCITLNEMHRAYALATRGR